MKDDMISRQAALDALNGEITVTGRANAEAVRGYVNLVSDRIKRLPSAQPDLSPCDVCRYYPPSSMDGKPCTMCPAERKNDE